MKKLSLYLVAFALAATACQPAPEAAPEAAAPDLAAIEAEIQAMEDAYSAAENAKDVDGILAYYADDAISMAPDKEPLVGKDAIRADLMERVNDTTNTSKVSFKVNTILADGDMVVETGSTIYTLEDGTSKTTGKYMSVFQKRDGKYVCVRDMWNRNMPKEAPAAEAAPM
jgi:uncharacterized protein (TIGR02246 family)